MKNTYACFPGTLEIEHHGARLTLSSDGDFTVVIYLSGLEFLSSFAIYDNVVAQTAEIYHCVAKFDA